MTALPQQPHLFTIDEYLQLGETEFGYTELDEGRLLLSPNPTVDHNLAMTRLAMQLHPQLPDACEVIHGIDIDLELASPDKPGFSRRPDLVVVRTSARQRQDREGGLIKASEVLIVIEIVSPSSRRTDNVVKRGLYADAGISYYWIIDLEKDSGEYRVTDPFPLKVNLDALASQ